MQRIVLIDTSVLCEILGVPGKSQHRDETLAEFARRVSEGETFVIPITALIETGNHIAHAKGDRRAAASALARMVEQTTAAEAPMALLETAWDAEFLQRLLAGDSTGSAFVDLAGSGRMGAGDVAILVERDLLRVRSAFSDITVWTLEAELGAHA